MTNEVAQNMRKVFLDFSPASIDITNYEELRAEVEKFSQKYTGLVFGRDDKKGAEDVRKELIALQKALEAERKEVKNLYNKPLSEFESKVKKLTDLIEIPLSEIREGLKEIESHEKEELRLLLITALEEKLKDVDVSLDEVVIEPSWLNKSAFTSKRNLTAKVSGEIDKKIADILSEKKRKETEIRILTEFCNAQEIDPAGWISQLEHRNAMEVIDLINLERERRERIAAEQEAKRLEHEEFLKRQEQTIKEAETFAEQTKQVTSQTITRQASIFSVSLKMFGTVEQLNDLNDYLIKSGIRAEEIQSPINSTEKNDFSNDYPDDDLPF